jgi:hypothetical protein
VVESQNVAAALVDHARTAPVPPRQRGIEVSAELEAVLLRALAKTPDERFASAAEFRGALRATPEWGRWSPEHARRWWAAELPELIEAATRPILPAA